MMPLVDGSTVVTVGSAWSRRDGDKEGTIRAGRGNPHEQRFRGIRSAVFSRRVLSTCTASPSHPQVKIYFALLHLHPVDLRITYRATPGANVQASRVLLPER